MEQEVRNSAFPKRIAHATKSFTFSVFNRDNDELSRSVVERFEWFADGASEFLRFVELGGTPRHHMASNSLVKHPFAGKELHHKIDRGKEYPSFLLCLMPFSTEERGIEVSLIFIHKDSSPPEGNYFFGIILQLSESTDIVGIAIKCLQSFAPHFKATVEIIRKELTQQPIQDFSSVPFEYSSKKEYRGNFHILVSQWFRPDPLCCKQHNGHVLQCINNLNIAGISDVSLEPVIAVNLQCHVSLSVYNKQKISLSEGNTFLQDSPYLKAGIVFMPHGSSEDMLPANTSSLVVAIVCTPSLL
ncbi:hypothetical protein BAE44_0000426 [Dichanthelium oligosanthes]|uniref:Uncharacterized protein n=1 Tax=Dichanthelium oligosanthes TaxID=888268 RepID=A0A1E5WMD0_9POAL|nr:hypothetical protein BAE44_0000426 [Dichanthelium oligosanthes]